MGEIRQVFLGAWVALILGMGAGTATAGAIPEALYDKASAEGAIRVIIQLRASTVPEGKLESAEAVTLQRQDITTMRSAVLAELVGTGYRTIREFETIPFVALEVGADALSALEVSHNIVTVEEDRLENLLLSQSVPLVGADQAWATGFDGTGVLMAILDSGIDKTLTFLSGKVVEEACFSFNGSCPNGLISQIGSGAGVPCTYAANGCQHGTFVAGIAAGAGTSFSGVAKGANLISIQVTSRFTGSNCAGAGEDPCALISAIDTIAGLERVFALRNQYAIAAVNMSLGSGSFTSPCDSQEAARKAVIDNLRSVGIATVAAAGNEGLTNALSAPACISSAVSVGSTTKSDVVSSFSNSASFLSLLAPGESITSFVPGGGLATGSGTSFSAPHVSGAWAILKQKKPTATVDEILTALTSTGVPITDPKNGLTKPRIRVNLALQNLGPATPVTAVSLAANLPSPQPVGTPILWTATATGGTAPQFRFWVQPQGGPFTLAQDYSASNTFPWTPSAAGDYVIIVWAKSSGSPAAFEAFAVAAFQAISVSGPQVRLFNELTCNAQFFTAELRAAQGNIWTSFTGVFSPFQTTARVIGPFEFRGCGPLVVVFPSTVTLPTAGPQLFTLGLDFQNNQVVLRLFQATASSGTAGESPLGSAVPLQTLEGSEPVPRTEEYKLRER